MALGHEGGALLPVNERHDPADAGAGGFASLWRQTLMKSAGSPASMKQLAALIKKGEGQTLEFKRSTAELRGAMHSLCAFLNGSGGTVIIGVGPDGRLIGQNVSDATQQKIAAAFHRTGAVEVWGRGTNRVIEMCERHGAALPVFEERQGFLVVTFKAPIADVIEERQSPTTQLPIQLPTQSSDPVHRLLNSLQRGELSSSQLREALEIKHRPTFRKNYLHPAMEAGFIEYTIPDKPSSRLQKYRLTSAGRAALERRDNS